MKTKLLCLAFLFFNHPAFSAEVEGTFKNNVSEKLELVSPQNNSKRSRNYWGYFEFWWKAPEVKGPFKIEVAKDPEFKDRIYFQTVFQPTDFTKQIPDAGTFYWRVTYKDQVSPTWSFTTHAPKDTQLKSFEATVSPRGQVSFRWEEPGKKGPYDIEISPDRDFKKLVFRKRVRTQSYEMNKFVDAGRFFWRVSMGRIKSPVREFRINQSMINASLKQGGSYIEPQVPEDGDTVDIEGDKIDFQWKAKTGESMYRLEVARTGDFGAIVYSGEFNTNAASIANLKERGTYFWRVTSARYESPVSSFILSESPSFIQKGFRLLEAVGDMSKDMALIFTGDYRVSALKGHDLDGSTSGTLKSSNFMNYSLTWRKKLFTNWDMELAGDLSILSRNPPASFEIRTPVTSLFGFQYGIFNQVFESLRVGLFVRYNEFELAKSITGSYFQMEKEGGASFGAGGQFSVWRRKAYSLDFAGHFYSTLPQGGNLQSAFTRELGVQFQFPLWNKNTMTVLAFWEDIGVIKNNAAQSSEAVGSRIKFTFD